LQFYRREDDPQGIDGKGQPSLILALRCSLAELGVRKRTALRPLTDHEQTGG